MESDPNIAEIVQTITALVQPKRIILFGSRARGAGHRYSDYDIALVGVEMDHRTERRLKEALDERLGILTVDLINLDRADPQFQEMVTHNGMVVYEN